MHELRWFHCILTTYGAWLPGDPRGFRTRHHREHVEGDYKHPPPRDLYAPRLARSRELQKHPTVSLSPGERTLLGQKAVAHLQERGVEVLSLALAAQHLHVQLKCHDGEVVSMLGRVKRALWYERRASGQPGRLWGVGRKIVPVKNRDHQRAVLRYILEHREQGAWAWCWRDAIK